MTICCGENGTLYIVGSNLKVYPLCKLVCRFLSVLKVELLYDPSIAHTEISQRNLREYTIEVLT